MSDTAQQELADAIVSDAAKRYIANRRERVDAFVDRHFTLVGSLALHRRAIGWDLLRAPANLFLAVPALAAADAGDSDTVEEVVVTATKLNAAKVLDVPASIQAISAA